MTNRAELISELNSLQGLLDIMVNKRKKKIIVRWILGTIFYTSLWHLTWVKYLLWIAIPLELILLAITVFAYYKLNLKIKVIQSQLDAY